MKKIAVFASGTGSNFQAIVEAIGSGVLRAELSLLVCDKPGAAVIEKADAANINRFVFNPKDYDIKSDFETEIVEKLQNLDVDYIILAGYMRLIGQTLLEAYPNKIINIHPSLLPDFPGIDAIGQAMRAGVKRTGVTIHYVDEGMDTGPIIAQRVIELSDDDGIADVERKIHEVEHQFYPETLDELFQKQEEKMKRALISVSDKTGVVEFTKELVKLGYDILSTGGTKKALEDSGISVTAVDEITGFPEILEGRVKTLHPFIHGGLLAKRDDAGHMSQLEEQGIQPIDLVCVNLYPFQQTIAKPDVTPEDAIENIDIGGPAMLRASAKNHAHLTVVVDSADYEGILNELRESGEVSKETKRTLAAKVFRHTAAYDAQIAEYMTELAGEEEPERVTFTYELKQSLRYGENPHQKAAFYKRPLGSEFSIATANQLHGKELSYNNIHDADAALQLVKDFEEPAAVAVKHMNPCGAGVGSSASEAFRKAYEADPTSIFGGIVAFNRPVDKETAGQLSEIFLEIVIAPDFTKEALEVLTAKKNIRLLTISFEGKNKPEKMLTSVEGGLLIQDQDSYTYEDADITIPTKRQPTEEELAALKLAWKVVKHVKSNAIVVAGSDMTLGVGAGQMNRVGAAKIALEQAGERAKGAVLASDAFFPMSDTVEEAAKAGIAAIIQPGGSIRDEESIKVADEYGIAMVFTGVRHFKH